MLIWKGLVGQNDLQSDRKVHLQKVKMLIGFQTQCNDQKPHYLKYHSIRHYPTFCFTEWGQLAWEHKSQHQAGEHLPGQAREVVRGQGWNRRRRPQTCNGPPKVKGTLGHQGTPEDKGTLGHHGTPEGKETLGRNEPSESNGTLGHTCSEFPQWKFEN